MEHFVQIPVDFNKIEDKARLNMIYTYALIRNQIKGKAIGKIYKASITIDSLSKEVGVSKQTIINYIKKLVDNKLILSIDKVQGTGEHKYNSYNLPYLSTYGIVLPTLLYAQDLSSQDKGLLILLKLNCQFGTNVLEYNSVTSLAKQLRVSKNTLGGKLKEYNSKGYLGLHKGWLNLAQTYFPLYLKEEPLNLAYKYIYDFCIKKDCIPPYKDFNDKTETDKSLDMIFNTVGYIDKDGIAHLEQDALETLMEQRLKNLPDKITFEYLKVALLGMKPNKIDKPNNNIIL